ncbi:MAG: radical SAM protein [Crenarchaeota archaeon]|nr:radical SAM protein [Thermoproteota archaeon]
MRLRSIIWILTGRCNLDCKHCYAKRFLKWVPEVPREEVERVLREALALGLEWVNFSGGELLLYKPWVLEVLADLSGRGIDASLVTNGMFITKERAEFMARHGIHAYVSLDGDEEAHEFLRGRGTWRAALKGIERLREAGAGFTLVMAVGRHNFMKTYKFVETAKSLGARHVAIIPIMPFGNALKSKVYVESKQFEEALRRFAEGLEDHDMRGSAWCAPWARLVVNSKRLYSGNCRRQSGMDIGPDGWTLLCDVLDFKINDVKGRPLEEVWEEYVSHPLVRRVSSPPKNACGCEHFRRCLGGCFARALAQRGAWEGDPLCPLLTRARAS